MDEITIRPIAHIQTDFAEKFGVPRQSGRVPELEGRIVFDKEYRQQSAVCGIEEFSHLWLIFGFSLVEERDFSPTVRPPRLGGNKRVGVFASRSPFRPSRLGLSCVRLLRVEHTNAEGAVLIVEGADLVDGTPIYDIKPYIPSSDRVDAKGGYADEHNAHRLDVAGTELLLCLPEKKREALIGCLADDPRPSYHEDEREYGMTFAGYEVKFSVSGETLTVHSLVKQE